MKTLTRIKLLCFLFLFSTSVLAQKTEKGIEFYYKGDYQKAVEALEKAVEAKENTRDAWLHLGLSYARLKMDEKAATALEKADALPVVVAEKTALPKLLSKPRADYTDEARQKQIQGTVKLAVEFGADGEVKFVYPFKTLPDGLTEKVIEVARNIKYEPATANGKAVSAAAILKYSFTIY